MSTQTIFFPEKKKESMNGTFTFYSDIQSSLLYDYVVLPITSYNSKRKLERKKILVDPHVLELKNSDEYSKIDLLHKYASGELQLQENEWITIDYPSNLNPKYSELFIKKTMDNNIKYKNNPKYICCIPYQSENIQSFKHYFRQLEPIWLNNPEKIVAIGSILHISEPMNHFVRQLFDFVKNSSLQNVFQLHIYGMSKKLIGYYIPQLLRNGFNVSVDQTKWFFGQLADTYKFLEDELHLDRKSEMFKKCRKVCNSKSFLDYMMDLTKMIKHKIIF